MTDAAAGTEYLSLEDLLDLVKSIGAGPVRDLGLLDSACHRPQASFFGHEAYPALAGKAAALMHSLACNHALVDGNKRLAWSATRTFCLLNDRDLEFTVDDAEKLVQSIARGELEAREIEPILTAHMTPV